MVSIISYRRNQGSVPRCTLQRRGKYKLVELGTFVVPESKETIKDH
jgi:hypothetical protein